jgi:4-amino-4-deoxy-L-arabinose transferase-like glycosyltransferase
MDWHGTHYCWGLFYCEMRGVTVNVSLLKRHSLFLVLLVMYIIVNSWFLMKHPGSIFNQPERFGEAISTYGSRDASLYAKMAWQLINEGIYGYNSEEPNAYVTPGQPFYLVAIFKVAEWMQTNHVMLARLSNMILNILTVVLIYTISIKLFKKQTIGLVASLLYCTHIAPYHYFRTTLTETPSIFLFLLSIWIFLLALETGKYRYHVLFGIVASIMLMFRPTPAPILLLAWAIVLLRQGFREGVKIGFIWTIGPLVIMLPWVIRNILLFDHMYLFSSHSGDPLLAGTNPFHMEDYPTIVQTARDLGVSFQEHGWTRIKQGFQENFPLYFAWFTVGKTIWLFIDPTGIPDGLGPYQETFPEFLSTFFIYQNAFLAIFGLLFAYLFRKHKPFMALSLVVLIYIVFSNIFLTIPRYGLIIMPILAIITGYGLSFLIEQITGKVKKWAK